MNFNEECITCLVESQYRLSRGHGTEQDRIAFLQDVCAAIPTAPEGVAAPWFIPVFTKAFERHFGIRDPYAEIKKHANEMSLAVLPRLEQTVSDAEDPLLAALYVSRTGNFLDFAVLTRECIEERMQKVLEELETPPLDAKEYMHFREELERGKKLLILGDNAGEIVFDTVLVKELKNKYPGLEILYAVRGGNAQNDATMEDAEVSGMTELVRVIGNGSAIPGTELDYISKELKDHLMTADLILSKGQANFETLVTCGLNIYYMFLCKCPKFARRFQVPPMTGMFINERRNEKFEK